MFTYKRLQIISFLIILALVFVVVLMVLRPFVNIIAMAIILAILFNPLFGAFSRRIKSETWWAILTLAVMLAIILIPLFLFGQLVLNELIDAYRKVASQGLLANHAELFSRLPSQLQPLAEAGMRDLNSLIVRLTSNAFETFSNILGHLSTFFISVFLLFFAVFYLLRDGKKIMKVLMDLSPIAANQESVLFSKINTAINGVVKGAFLVALSQGTSALIGFLIFGVPQPILWAMFTVLAALVPTVGTALSIVPAILLLFFTGHVTAAIGLAIWAALGVGLIDNFLGPKLVSSRLQVHPLLILFSILGGIQFFGFVGFLLGPIIMAIFIALVDMYRTDFKNYLEG